MKLKATAESTTDREAFSSAELDVEHVSDEIRSTVVNEAFGELSRAIVNFFKKSPGQELKRLVIEVEEENEDRAFR